MELAGGKVKSVSIQLAPNVFRRENTTVFEHEAVLEGVTPFRQTVYAKAQGKYRISQPEGARWKLNGEALSGGEGGRILWALREGQWTLEVSNGVTTATRTFHVRQP